jgi:phosphoglycerate dehydrogenase-like enzyme
MTAPQHRGVSASAPEVIARHRRPAPGPIAVIPATGAFAPPGDVFVTAVREGGGRVAELGPDTRGLIWLSYGGADALKATLDAHPGIGWVQLPYAGVDAFAGLLAGYADRLFPLWTSAKGAYSQPVAEHALALVLALLRVLPERVRATRWPTGAKTGTSLFGRTVVIVGAGGIALELIRLLEPFGVHVTVVRRGTAAVAGADRTVTADRLLAVLPEADVVVVAAASTPGTRRLIGPAEFEAMKRTAVLVNIARGDLVDTDALTAALAAGRIAGAGVDVTEPEPLPEGHPLWAEPNVIITPHSADTPEMTVPLLAERIRENVAAFLGDGRFVGVVDAGAGY